MSSRRRPVARAAILAASSAASVPELVNRTRCTEGTRAASSSPRGDLVGMGAREREPARQQLGHCVGDRGEGAAVHHRGVVVDQVQVAVAVDIG
jgi:hypothetical protein